MIHAKRCAQNHIKINYVMNVLDSIFKVIIVHEDPVSGQQAASVLRRLAARLESEFAIEGAMSETSGNVWKFEGLQNPEQMELAVAKAAEADMIIISAGNLSKLPDCVRNWLESALPRKRGEPAALVALLDRTTETHTATSHPGDYLRELAERFGLDFFCNADETRRRDSGIAAVLSRAEDDSAPRPESISYQANNYRGWGIND
jgi:hypothetical protein